MTNFIIGDIGNTITKICLVESKNYKIKKIKYINSKKIHSNKNLILIFKKIIKSKKICKFALFSSVVPKYQSLLKSGHDLGYLLFISGSCINYLGGDADNNDIFMLDGARRLYAHILNESNPNILFIDLKTNSNEK